MTHFLSKKQQATLRQQSQIIQHQARRLNKSKLDPYRDWILLLHQQDYSVSSIARIVAKITPIEISHNALHHYIKKWKGHTIEADKKSSNTFRPCASLTRKLCSTSTPLNQAIRTPASTVSKLKRSSVLGTVRSVPKT